MLEVPDLHCDVFKPFVALARRGSVRGATPVPGIGPVQGHRGGLC